MPECGQCTPQRTASRQSLLVEVQVDWIFGRSGLGRKLVFLLGGRYNPLMKWILHQFLLTGASGLFDEDCELRTYVGPRKHRAHFAICTGAADRGPT